MTSFNSIRTFLVINLLLGVIFITSFSIMVSISFDHKELQKYLDSQLVLSALTIQAFLNDNPNSHDIAKIQNSINQITSLWKDSCNSSYCVKSKKVRFQVWDKNNRVILHSPDFPNASIDKSSQTGFNEFLVNNTAWRIFTTHSPTTNFSIATAESHDARDELANRLTQDLIFILIIMAAFLSLMIWFIVNRGLGTIMDVTREIKDRAPLNLKPVNLAKTPLEIKPLAQELNNLFARLRDAFFREKRFSADAAHELRTPLAALRVQAHVALNATDENERRNALFKVLKGVERSTHVVQQLLTLNRATSNPADYYNNKVALNKEASKIIGDLVPLAKEKNISIELIAPEDQVIIISNTIMIGVLIKNLVDNAIRYIQPEGKIQVIVDSDEQHVYLKVIDDGPGISPELRERVFDRFFRVIGNEVSGSGLGLSIVKEIIQASDATIAMQTPKSGKGLEVLVTFKKYEN